MTHRHVLTTFAAVLISLGTSLISSAPVAVVWDPQTTDVLVSHFRNATMTFTGFVANRLDAIEGGGVPALPNRLSASYHTHITIITMTVNLDLRIDGVWTTVFTDSTISGQIVLIVNTFTPVSFSAATRDSRPAPALPEVGEQARIIVRSDALGVYL